MLFTRSRHWAPILFTILSVALIVYIFASERYAPTSPKPQVDINGDGVFSVEDHWYISTEFLARVITAYFILLTLFIIWIVFTGYAHLARLGMKITGDAEGSQQLLLDLRDGTKHFYKEKRRSLRVKTDITAQLISNNVRDFIKTIDLSYDGALIRTNRKFKVGDIVELDLFLPLFPQPVHVKVLVVRIVPDETGTYQVGVKYLEMPRDERRKLIETLDTLAKSPQARPGR